VPRLEALYSEWEQEPPIAPFIAAYFGFKPKMTHVNAVEMLSMFPTGNISLAEMAK
jgi:hypothetical protein